MFTINLERKQPTFPDNVHGFRVGAVWFPHRQTCDDLGTGQGKGRLALIVTKPACHARSQAGSRHSTVSLVEKPAWPDTCDHNHHRFAWERLRVFLILKGRGIQFFLETGSGLGCFPGTVIPQQE